MPVPVLTGAGGCISVRLCSSDGDSLSSASMTEYLVFTSFLDNSKPALSRVGFGSVEGARSSRTKFPDDYTVNTTDIYKADDADDVN